MVFFEKATSSPHNSMPKHCLWYAEVFFMQKKHVHRLKFNKTSILLLLHQWHSYRKLAVTLLRVDYNTGTVTNGRHGCHCMILVMYMQVIVGRLFSKSLREAEERVFSQV